MHTNTWILEAIERKERSSGSHRKRSREFVLEDPSKRIATFLFRCDRAGFFSYLTKKIALLQVEIDYALSPRHDRTRYKREQQFKQYNSISFASGEKSILQRFNWSTRGIILFSLSTSISFERRTWKEKKKRRKKEKEKRARRKRTVSSQPFRECLKILYCDVNNCDILQLQRKEKREFELSKSSSNVTMTLAMLARCVSYKLLPRKIKRIEGST